MEAGQERTVTYIHWLTPTKVVRIRNHGETTALKKALSRVTDPAIANRTRSSGHFVDVFIIFFLSRNVYLVIEIDMRKNLQHPFRRIPVLVL